MHVACGRQETAVTGCVRAGVLCWQVLEIVLFELLGSSGKRVFDAQLGFEFLQIGAMHGKEMSAD
jgi:predicted DNA-binding protein with PD1-like motif